MDLPHVRDVEEGGGFAGGAMLLLDRVVLHGHGEARERHHAGAELAVHVGERGLAELGQVPDRIFQAVRVLCSSMVIVIGPTPRRWRSDEPRDALRSLEVHVADELVVHHGNAHVDDGRAGADPVRLDHARAARRLRSGCRPAGTRRPGRACASGTW